MRYDRRLNLICAWLLSPPSVDVRILRVVDDPDTATSGSGRPPTAQFAPRPVSIQDGRAKVWKKVTRR
jgi:hypothetical protein